MLSYILLFALVGIVILGVIRASKQKQPGAIRVKKRAHSERSHKEPFVGTSVNEQQEAINEIETVGKPRIISRAPQPALATTLTDDFEDEPEDDVVLVRSPAAARDTHTNYPKSNYSNAGYVSTHTPKPSYSKSQQTHDLDEPDLDEINIQQNPQASPVAAIDVPPLLAAQPETSKNTAAKQINDVVVLHVISNAGYPYRGYELLQAILTVGLRYGKWNIFHRHMESTGRGPILFSLASSVEPGTFDLAKMGSFATPGLTLFMRMTDLDEPAQALELLISAAKQLTAELGGTLCDEKRFPLTAEKLALWRAQFSAVV